MADEDWWLFPGFALAGGRKSSKRGTFGFSCLWTSQSNYAIFHKSLPEKIVAIFSLQIFVYITTAKRNIFIGWLYFYQPMRIILVSYVLLCCKHTNKIWLPCPGKNRVISWNIKIVNCCGHNIQMRIAKIVPCGPPKWFYVPAHLQTFAIAEEIGFRKTLNYSKTY